MDNTFLPSNWRFLLFPRELSKNAESQLFSTDSYCFCKDISVIQKQALQDNSLKKIPCHHLRRAQSILFSDIPLFLCISFIKSIMVDGSPFRTQINHDNYYNRAIVTPQ